MTKEEIKEYLKENLSIETSHEGSYMGAGGYTKITLKLEDEVISEDYIYEAH